MDNRDACNRSRSLPTYLRVPHHVHLLCALLLSNHRKMSVWAENRGQAPESRHERGVSLFVRSFKDGYSNSDLPAEASDSPACHLVKAFATAIAGAHSCWYPATLSEVLVHGKLWFEVEIVSGSETFLNKVCFSNVEKLQAIQRSALLW